MATLGEFSGGMLNLRRSLASSVTDADLNLEKKKILLIYMSIVREILWRFKRINCYWRAFEVKSSIFLKGQSFVNK